jgi:GNAT superfamily N-acetyltransferase
MRLRPVLTRSDLEDFHAVESAALDHDFVALPADPIHELLPVLDGKPRAGNLTKLWVGTEDDKPVAALNLTFFTLDNLDAVNVDGSVHPDHRRRGYARALLGHALDVVRAERRHRVYIEAPWARDGGEGPAFGLLSSFGARQVNHDYRRLLDLRGHHPDVPPAPVGYRIVTWIDKAPEELVDGLAYLMGRMSTDAPLGDMDYEPEKWDAARYRDSEQDAKDRERTRIATAVVHEATGQVAGLTDIGVNRKRQEISYQWQTIVDPDHRGHRLGLLLKASNHRHLVEQVPQARWINTWNATSNSFMIDVNVALGFEIAEKWSEWQLDLPTG